MYLTQSKGTFDDSDEVPLSRTLASRACQGLRARMVSRSKLGRDSHQVFLLL